ncbi:MSMEG_0570 family nitrogen starvation response protein [Mycolicibacterium moriokaense]|nr:MSMEG_0570 family nitrogen starvation response protein [Mycolicibacterium moriokaense]
MPEMTFEVRWPDGRLQRCYSPSLVMHDYLDTGESYTVADFVHRSSTALTVAGERVRAKFGFMCTSAAATTEEITNAAVRFDSTAMVQITAMQPPLEKS